VKCGYLLSAKILGIKHADCFAIRSLAFVDSAVRYVNHIVCQTLALKPFCKRVLLPEVRTLS